MASNSCVVYYISVKDLEALGKQIIALGDALTLIKLKIENKMLADIDFFTFPKRYL